MDKLESLSSTLSNITLYDIKTMYNQAKNVVLNVSEMEAKVREATNDDPWGASSSLMSEIAQGTFHFQHFNEIMPAIYSRFMEKEARQWRQIYKSLQLLEYLIKHGSERVVDDARSHISTLKMLRNFHYIDEKGKDEGINVRNRAREIIELLSDVEKIRTERRKAKVNKSKYVGVGNDGFGGGGYSGGFSGGSSGRYGGFGSDSLGGGGGGGGGGSSYGGYDAGGSSSYGGGVGGGSSFRDTTSRRQFEEYSAGDDEITSTSTTRRSDSVRQTPTRKPTAPPPAPEPVANLLDFDDAPAVAPPAPEKALPIPAAPAVSLDDDDFGDLQAAPTAAPAASVANQNLMSLLNATPARATGSAAPTGFVQSQPQTGFGMGGVGHRQTPSLSAQFSSPIPAQSPPVMQPQSFSTGGPLKPTQPSMGFGMGGATMGGGTTLGGTPAARPQSAAASTAKSSNFDDLWSLGLGSAAKPVSTNNTGTGGKSIKDLEKEKAQAGLWGNQAKPPPGAKQFGAFGNLGTAPPPSSSAGNDDFLL